MLQSADPSQPLLCVPGAAPGSEQPRGQQYSGKGSLAGLSPL